MEKQLKYIGKHIKDTAAIAKVTGKIKYTSDKVPKEVLYVAILKSPHAHAKIVSIDTSAAESLVGVEAVVTHEDVKDYPVKIISETDEGFGPWSGIADTHFLNDEVMFVGDEVAAVAAVSPQIGEKALKLIKVEYEVLPAILDIEDARKPDAPKLTPKGNFCIRNKIEWQKGLKALEEAEYTFEDEMAFSAIQAGFIEPNAYIFEWSGDDLEIKCKTQDPWRDHLVISQFLKMPLNRISVDGYPSGGTFGGVHQGFCKALYITAVLSRKAGKPVYFEASRHETMTLNPLKQSCRLYNKIGFDKNRKWTAIHLKIVVDDGARGNPRPVPCRIFFCPNGLIEATGIHTNRSNQFGCTRAVDDVLHNAAFDTLIDQAAEKFGTDPVEFRIQCFDLKAGDYLNWGGIKETTLSSCAARECLEKGSELSQWKKRWKGWKTPVAVEGTKRRGIGVSLGWHPTAGSFSPAYHSNIMVLQDGTVEVRTSIIPSSDSQVGHIQICAEVLGAKIEEVRFIREKTPDSPINICWLSSGIATGGWPTVRAAEDVKKKLFAYAAPILDASPGDLESENSTIFIKGSRDKSITFREVAEKVRLIESTGTAMESDYVWRVSSFIAAFAEVEVDTETGGVKVLNVVSACDVGKVVNPSKVKGQLEGGMASNLGYALSEEIVWDTNDGTMLNPNLLDFKMLTAMDIPDRKTIFVECEDPETPFGAKGIGEMSNVPYAAAVLNAIYNAAGVRIKHLPATPERVLRALGKIEEY
jgi:xanthine dehydrogenase molybdenum-binding subunit